MRPVVVAWAGPGLVLVAGFEWMVGRSVDLRLRHARRLGAAGQATAALRVYRAIGRDIAVGHAWMRLWTGSAP